MKTAFTFTGSTSALILIFTLCIVLSSLTASAAGKWKFSDHLNDGDSFMGIRLLGGVHIKPNKDGKLQLREISGLAWDEDEQLLYGISDDGYIAHIKISIIDGFLADAEAIANYRLKDIDGNPRDEKNADAEGVTIEKSDNGIKGDSLLTIVLDNPSRIEQYNPKGEFIKTVQLPDLLQKSIDSNKEIEVNAISGNSGSGYILVTNKAMEDGYHKIYSTNGDEIDISLDKPEEVNIVGLDSRGPAKHVFLDRRYKSILSPVIYCIRSINSNEKVKDIACFNSKEGWNIDNFEAIAKQKDSIYFIISDDNESRLQKTLLIYFKVLTDC